MSVTFVYESGDQNDENNKFSVDLKEIPWPDLEVLMHKDFLAKLFTTCDSFKQHPIPMEQNVFCRLVVQDVELVVTPEKSEYLVYFVFHVDL